MASITADALKDILEAETYPYPVKFFTYVPKFPIYPYCIVRKAQPQGTTETITDITKQEGFEIIFYLRYNRRQEDEEENQTTVENTILATLESVNFGTNALFSETKSWQRSPLNVQGIYGSQSRITVSIVDKASKSGSGILGYTDKIELNSDTTPIQIQCLSFNESYGNGMDTHNNDIGQSIWDTTSSETHSITFTYESTTSRDSLIKTLADARDEVKGKVIRGGVSTNYNFLVGNTTRAGQFDNIERATTVLYVNGTWT